MKMDDGNMKKGGIRNERPGNVAGMVPAPGNCPASGCGATLGSSEKSRRNPVISRISQRMSFSRFFAFEIDANASRPIYSNRTRANQETRIYRISREILAWGYGGGVFLPALLPNCLPEPPIQTEV